MGCPNIHFCWFSHENETPHRRKKGNQKAAQKMDRILITPEILIYNRGQVIRISDKTNDVSVVVEQVIFPVAG